MSTADMYGSASAVNLSILLNQYFLLCIPTENYCAPPVITLLDAEAADRASMGGKGPGKGGAAGAAV